MPKRPPPGAASAANIVLAVSFHAFIPAASVQIIGRILAVTIGGATTKVVNRIWFGFGLGL